MDKTPPAWHCMIPKIPYATIHANSPRTKIYSLICVESQINVLDLVFWVSVAFDVKDVLARQWPSTKVESLPVHTCWWGNVDLPCYCICIICLLPLVKWVGNGEKFSFWSMKINQVHLHLFEKVQLWSDPLYYHFARHQEFGISLISWSPMTSERFHPPSFTPADIGIGKFAAFWRACRILQLRGSSTILPEYTTRFLGQMTCGPQRLSMSSLESWCPCARRRWAAAQPNRQIFHFASQITDWLDIRFCKINRSRIWLHLYITYVQQQNAIWSPTGLPKF